MNVNSVAQLRLDDWADLLDHDRRNSQGGAIPVACILRVLSEREQNLKGCCRMRPAPDEMGSRPPRRLPHGHSMADSMPFADKDDARRDLWARLLIGCARCDVFPRVVEGISVVLIGLIWMEGKRAPASAFSVKPAALSL
jgi:hypothetical protein